MAAKQKVIGVVTGSRADWGLLEPLIKACQEDFDVKLYVTGSHLSHQFGYTVNDIKFPIAKYVDVILDTDEKAAVTLSQSLGLSQFASLFRDNQLDLLIVLGDRFEIVPPVLAAYNVGIPVVHIEGDDTTLGSLDEGYRGVVRALSSHHFTVEEYGSLGCIFPDVQPDPSYEVIIVYHPCIGWSNEEYRNILNACEGYNCLIINSNADAGGRELGGWVIGKNSKAVAHIKSISRAKYISFLKGCKFIIGNSSSGIIEAPSLRVPSIDVGNRQKGRKRAACVIHCEGTLDAIQAAIQKVTPTCWFGNPYEQEGTIERMVESLKLICK